MKTRLERNCVFCNKLFFKEDVCSMRRWDESRKYCSVSCSKKGNTFRRGKRHLNIWNKGIEGLSGEFSPSWKGDKVGYHGLHKWVQQVKGKPTKCERCGTDGLTKQKIHWANKSREYKRVEGDWIRLCASCHLIYDRNNLVWQS